VGREDLFCFGLLVKEINIINTKAAPISIDSTKK